MMIDVFASVVFGVVTGFLVLVAFEGTWHFIAAVIRSRRRRRAGRS